MGGRMSRRKPQQKSSAVAKKKASPKPVVKKVDEEPLYWTPPAKQSGEFSAPNVFKKLKQQVEEESNEPLYYVPPKTPQEAIDRGIVSKVAIRPADFLPHHLRKSPSGRPPKRLWHCLWGCEGVLHPVYSTEWPGATHDYYCPYWEILSLFPEWVEDANFPLKPWHRPPRSEDEKDAKGWPPNDQWNRTEWYGFEKGAAAAAIVALANGERPKDPIAFGGIVSQESPLHSKSRRRNSGRSSGTPRVSPPTWDGPRDIGGGFTIADDKPRGTRTRKRSSKPD
jgi:hypothetical protein